MRVSLILLLIICFTAACREQSKKTAKKRDSSLIVKKANTKNTPPPPNADTIITDTIPRIVVPDTAIQVVKTPHDTSNLIQMTYPGEFHDGEVDPQLIKLKWVGLFNGKTSCYTKPVFVKFSREPDYMADEDKDNTGWLVTCPNKKNNIFLISGIDYLKKDSIVQVKLHDESLLPGQKEEFNYSGVLYTLYATGNGKTGYITNYKLYLMANIKGHCFNQLLFACPFFGEAFQNQVLTEISFVGDIDGDNIPDFIINTSDALTIYEATLFLSKSAGDKSILKIVGSWSSSE